MGNFNSQSLSSSTVNGVTVHDQQSSSCGWYNPFCSNNNSGAMTQVGPSAYFVVGTMAVVLILVLLILTVIHRYRARVVSSPRKIPENELVWVKVQEFQIETETP